MVISFFIINTETPRQMGSCMEERSIGVGGDRMIEIVYYSYNYYRLMFGYLSSFYDED